MNDALRAAPTADLIAEVQRIQNQQKRYSARSEIHREIGETLLAPLFDELARGAITTTTKE